MELIFELSRAGRRGVKMPTGDVPESASLDPVYTREKDAELPSLSEPEVVRHFTNLSKMNFGVDSHFYPLGSCTMKYNPKITERIAAFSSFASIHPLQPQLVNGGMLTQGALEVISDLENVLCEITGMDEFTTQPMAGAHGELTGIMLIAAHHREKGDRRKYILIPDSGHGTNPASAAIAGYEVKTIKSDDKGVMDMNEFRKEMNEDVAGVMLTCPNTLGIFNPRIKELADLAHASGALMYYDGANLNAIMGKARPGDLGFDIVHLNLHKTFATPHGGGGPGAGPVGVKKHLAEFLPTSRVVKRKDGTFTLDYDRPKSIGYISQFYGNFGVLLKAYAYILIEGKEGLIEVSENAVLNANYLMRRLKGHYDIPYGENCMHEFVISCCRQAKRGVHAVDIAKALIDKGIHPPTIYFPLNVKEAIMIEPTETESRETLDEFVRVMIELAELAEKDPVAFKEFPKTTSVGRLDEVKAARDMNISA
ncbi:MAG: aminomethyl-transferring glycine dehydrogenase subunit GcvPB [Candidatus Omnitrophica bacterium]|nr:aminomethyl-transferring glycine dehydrogenase subunit GcvPB [Candidatus Omnitrophota bacterium]MBU1127479.1 aminomethyl-transferring glycine dehydrogenase subunit GcvPB [Candidatus Omnitrophota bacterium]MBU1785047.1 aminomethyl-transferring glycine dehydrogenase subunit GcvPB [Candidatus Omnitrophota bacterium]MBU1851887.1 aminomethyl-transferring glycine dehydrogenase subunit GcvPB [Candidatus Omnitrophota bacterium]